MRHVSRQWSRSTAPENGLRTMSPCLRGKRKSLPSPTWPARRPLLPWSRKQSTRRTGMRKPDIGRADTRRTIMRKPDIRKLDMRKKNIRRTIIQKVIIKKTDIRQRYIRKIPIRMKMILRRHMDGGAITEMNIRTRIRRTTQKTAPKPGTRRNTAGMPPGLRNHMRMRAHTPRLP